MYTWICIEPHLRHASEAIRYDTCYTFSPATKHEPYLLYSPAADHQRPLGLLTSRPAESRRLSWIEYRPNLRISDKHLHIKWEKTLANHALSFSRNTSFVRFLCRILCVTYVRIRSICGEKPHDEVIKRLPVFYFWSCNQYQITKPTITGINHVYNRSILITVLPTTKW